MNISQMPENPEVLVPPKILPLHLPPHVAILVFFQDILEYLQITSFFLNFLKFLAKLAINLKRETKQKNFKMDKLAKHIAVTILCPAVIELSQQIKS